VVVLVSLYVLFSPNPGAGPLFPQSDKVVHAALFAALAGAGRWRFGPLRAVLVAALAYGALSEVVQWLALPHRSGDVLDVLADSVGALLGWLLVGGLLRRLIRV
jgi:VanZ family protein